MARVGRKRPIASETRIEESPAILDARGRPARAENDRGFSPGQPPAARLPEGAPPRSRIPPTSVNLVAKPRTWQGGDLTAFDQLRALAATDLVRIAIQDVKSQIEGMSWDVISIAGVKATPALDAGIEAVKAWVRRPYPLARKSFRSFLSSCLEEVLVTDALSLHPRIDRAGRPIGLMQIDGSTIYPIVDDLGEPPQPPAPAYQQIVHGLAETEFTLDELWYRPSGPRPDVPYGRSPTEMVLLTVNLALRSQLFDLTYYTEGDIPEGFFAIEGKSSEELREIQESFDAVLEGSDAARRKIRFVGAGTYQPTKSRQWDYEFQEWLARVIAWAFGVSPMPIAKVMNRATAGVMEESSLEAGVRPRAEFLAEIITEYVQGPLGWPELEFKFGSDETEDPSVVYQRNVAYFARGGLTINEYLQQTGSQPIEGEAGELRIIETPSGPVFLQDLFRQREQRLEAAAVAIQPAGAPPAPPPSEPQPGQQPKAAPTDDDDAAETELARWRTFALKRVREGRSLRKFEARAIPSGLARRVEVGLHRAGADSRRIGRVFSAARKGAFLEEPPESLAKPTKKIEDLIAAWLKDQEEAVIEAATQDLEAAEAAEAEKAHMYARVLAKGLAELELPAEDLLDPLARAIADAWKAGAAETVELGGFSFDLDTAPELSLQYARERAAELVGKRILADGTIVDNPNPQFAITQKLRDEVQAKVLKGLEEGWSTQRLAEEIQGGPLSPSRAFTIARTETGFAFNEGAAKVFEEAGVALVDVLDGAGCIPVGHDDTAGPSSGVAGRVDLDKLSDGQVWTITQMRAHRLGHPNCVRAFVEHES